MFEDLRNNKTGKSLEECLVVSDFKMVKKIYKMLSGDLSSRTPMATFGTDGLIFILKRNILSGVTIPKLNKIHKMCEKTDFKNNCFVSPLYSEDGKLGIVISGMEINLEYGIFEDTSVEVKE